VCVYVCVLGLAFELASVSNPLELQNSPRWRHMLWQQFVLDPVQLYSYFLLHTLNEIILASEFAFVLVAKIAELIACAAMAYSAFPQEVEYLCALPTPGHVAYCLRG